MTAYEIREALNNFIINANVDEDSDLFKQAVAAVNELDQYELVDRRDSIAIVWCIEDVQSIRPDLTDEQAGEVLSAVESHHDCNLGITWDTLCITADEMFEEPEGEI